MQDNRSCMLLVTILNLRSGDTLLKDSFPGVIQKFNKFNHTSMNYEDFDIACTYVSLRHWVVQLGRY